MSRSIQRLLIANRGEVAVRIIRACREMGIETVLVVSTADRDTLGARWADTTMCIGPPDAGSSYLNRAAILTTALKLNCDAIHPGYGFLAEDPTFAAMCEEADVIFVGPRSEFLRLFGDKVAARKAALAAGVPLTTGSAALSSATEAVDAARTIGFPVVLKAVHGGGGKGMRVAGSEEQLLAGFGPASAEALAAFGDGAMYLERWVANGRHIEVQVLCDQHGAVVQLGDRDCSVQRRHQKLVEEAPAPDLSDDLRQAMGTAAVGLLRSVGYDSIATVEFLLDVERGDFFFLEVNPRLQVEHGVTELVSGVDVVETQIDVASGGRLKISQDDVAITGVALECRINAEDPSLGFRPSPGAIRRWILPNDARVRVDTHCFEGYVVPPFYDSLLAKVMYYGEDRSAAMNGMVRALGLLGVDGVQTTARLLQSVVDSEPFRSAQVSTMWLDAQLSDASAARRLLPD